MKIGEKETILQGTKGPIRVERIKGGIPHIDADHELDLHYGLGYLHGTDRQLYMWLLKLIGTGTASEKLRADEDLIEADRFLRWINLAGGLERERSQLSPDDTNALEAYCKGINDATEGRRPFEFRLVGYKPDRWTIQDSMLLGRMVGYIGLTQSQGEVGKFIIQMIQNEIDSAKIKELFPAISEEISPDLVSILKKTKITYPIINQHLKALSILPSAASSNNWALSPSKTASGKAMLCGDPHLELRLPSVWYTTILKSNDYFAMGASLPGVPGIICGRTPWVAWSPTYAPMNMIDYFIEEVKDGKYRRGNTWVPFTIREETIRPKKKSPITFKIYENNQGIIEGEPIEDGYYLNYAWASRVGTIVESITNLLKLQKAQNVKEAMDCFTGFKFSPFYWVMADRSGNIGFQTSGLFPQKAENSSGLLPYYGWEEHHHWRGIIDPRKYPRTYNPEEGFFTTANQSLNHLGVPITTNSQSSYRADRITSLLSQDKKFTVPDMKKMHYDYYSLQAEKFMEIIQPLLPATGNGEILREWDLCYDPASLGATLFEQIYHELLMLVFGDNGLGMNTVQSIIDEVLLAEFHGHFDAVLLKKESIWFGGRSQENIYRAAIERGLQGEAKPYGKTHKIVATNMFFGGQLPRFLGFDYGPFELPGGRATIHQGQIFKSAGRDTNFIPTYRMICDFSSETLLMNIAGGPSDRRFGRYYKTLIKEWLRGEYTELKP
ncbi:MAG: penicillin acylase family protein [Candidatus Heimdallarchaeota archaeon]